MNDKKITAYLCTHCGSPDVGLDATARWSAQAQDWELGGVHDNSWCDNCSGESDLVACYDELNNYVVIGSDGERKVYLATSHDNARQQYMQGQYKVDNIPPVSVGGPVQCESCNDDTSIDCHDCDQYQRARVVWNVTFLTKLGDRHSAYGTAQVLAETELEARTAWLSTHVGDIVTGCQRARL